MEQENILNWLAQRFLYTEKIKKGDIRLVFLITKEDYEYLRKLNPYLNTLMPELKNITIVKH